MARPPSGTESPTAPVDNTPTPGAETAVGGQVLLPVDTVASRSTLDVFASLFVTAVEAITAGNVEAVGEGVTVRLVRLQQSDISANGTITGGELLATTQTNTDGQYSFDQADLPEGIGIDTCRLMLQVDAGGSATRALVDSDQVDVSFQSEAVLRLVLETIAAGDAELCDFSSTDIANIYDAVDGVDATIQGTTPAEVNAAATAIARSDETVQAAVRSAIPVQDTPTTQPSTSTPVPPATATRTNPPPTDTERPTRTPTNTVRQATFTPTGVPTATAATFTPTGTPTTTASATLTPTNTNTRVPTSTNTPVPTNTNTPAPTNTNTAAPTSTNTAAPTNTNTQVATATATQTFVPTATMAGTATATFTPTGTMATTATATATATEAGPTNTAAPPTDTPTVAPPTDTPTTAPSTNTPTNTNTQVPTNTNTPVPTSTNTPSPTVTNTVAPPTATFTPTVEPGLGEQLCVLNSSTSRLFLQFQTSSLLVRPKGSIDISCGAEGAGGRASCGCTVNAIDPIPLLGIGDVCVAPAPITCPLGAIDCDGGTAADLSLQGNHNIGTCTTQGGCESACNSYCSAIGAGFSRLDSTCEGVCAGGPNADMACEEDADCPEGNCPGKEPVQGGAHDNVCNCTCTGQGLGSPSPAGTFECKLGLAITVERDNNQICGDVEPSITLSPLCGPLTSAFGNAFALNANNGSGNRDRLPPQPNGRPCSNCELEAQGAGVSCPNYSAGNLTGLKMIGYLQFWDSSLGDILTQEEFICQ